MRTTQEIEFNGELMDVTGDYTPGSAPYIADNDTSRPGTGSSFHLDLVEWIQKSGDRIDVTDLVKALHHASSIGDAACEAADEAFDNEEIFDVDPRDEYDPDDK